MTASRVKISPIDTTYPPCQGNKTVSAGSAPKILWKHIGVGVNHMVFLKNIIHPNAAVAPKEDTIELNINNKNEMMFDLCQIDCAGEAGLAVAVKPILEILYQDEYLVAVNKPAGLFVHRSYMDKDEKYFALQLVRDQIGQYVYPVHRLDRPTSGVLIFALSAKIARLMGQAFTDKTIKKTYYALTRGHLLGNETIDYPLKEKLDKLGDKNVSRHKEPQQAQTAYQSILTASLAISLGKFDTVRYSLIKLEPSTGRRHQIRRHLAHLRHPIIGDINYGDNKQNPFFREYFGFKRLMLIAKNLDFVHPITNVKIALEVKFDQQWLNVFDKLKWHCTP